MLEARAHRLHDRRVPGLTAQLEREDDAIFIIGAQRLQQRTAGRGKAQGVGGRVGLDPAGAQNLPESAAVLPIQQEEHDEPYAAQDCGQDRDRGDRNAKRVEHQDQKEADRGVGPALDERVDGRFDAPPLARSDRRVVDLARRLPEGLGQDALERPHGTHHPQPRAEGDPRGHQEHRGWLKPGGDPQAEPLEQPPRQHELEEEREPVECDVEPPQELSEVVRVGIVAHDVVLELEVDERPHDHGQGERGHEDQDVGRARDDLPG